MFYIYAILDLRKPGRFETPFVSYLFQPFYIGKSYGEHRLDVHLNSALRSKKEGGTRSLKENLILKMIDQYNELPYEIVPISSDEEKTYEIENQLTNHFGLISEGGILSNVVHGGIGGNRGRIFCKDETGTTFCVEKTDGRINDTIFPVYETGLVVVKSDNGFIKIHKDDPDYVSGKYENMHTGRKRSEHTKSAISQGKLKYKFTDEHLQNITEANRKISREVHVGAKRKDSTKEAISKSRTGSKSKIANTWKFIDPAGTVYVFKGAFNKFCSMMNLSAQRMRNYRGTVIGQPRQAGHVNEKVINCNGWWCDYSKEEPNFEFFFIKKEIENRMKPI